MPAPARSIPLLSLFLLCAPLVAACEQTALEQAVNTSPAETRRSREWGARVDESRASAHVTSRGCVDGQVVSSGVLGRPLDGVSVTSARPDGTEERTRTDLNGRFQLCPSGAGDGNLRGVVRASERASVTFSHPGWLTETVEVRFGAASRDAPLEVRLERAP